MNSIPKSLIFIVDDEVTLADSLAMVFQVKGYRVKVFETAEEALAKFIGGLSPIAVIIDGHLPGMKGTEGITAFKESGYEGEFIGISSYELEEEMLAAGAKSFWAKPFEIVDFVGAMNQIRENAV